MALTVMGRRIGDVGGQRRQGLRAIERLDQALLVYAEHHGHQGWIHAEVDDVAHIPDEPRIGRQPEGLLAMRIQFNDLLVHDVGSRGSRLDPVSIRQASLAKIPHLEQLHFNHTPNSNIRPTVKTMKHLIRMAAALLAIASAGPAFAGDCYIHALMSSTANPKARIVLDVVKVDVPYDPLDSQKVVLNEPEKVNLEARARAYTKRNLQQAQGTVDRSVVFDDVRLTYGGTCYLNASLAEEMREIGISERVALLHGDWGMERVPVAAGSTAQSAKTGESKGGSGGPLPHLTATPDPSKLTPEQTAAQKQRADAYKKSQENAAAATRAKAAQDAAAAKASEDKQRQVCMQPERRGDCGCLKFFPKDVTRVACTK